MVGTRTNNRLIRSSLIRGLVVAIGSEGYCVVFVCYLEDGWSVGIPKWSRRYFAATLVHTVPGTASYRFPRTMQKYVAKAYLK